VARRRPPRTGPGDDVAAVRGYVTQNTPAATPVRAEAAEHEQPDWDYGVVDPDKILAWWHGPKGLSAPVDYVTEDTPP
jgi:hypothetical protein